MNNDWITWALQGALALLWGTTVYFYKRDKDATDKKIEDQKIRIDTLERKLNDLPFVYTTREDFIRATTSIDTKLDKIRDLIIDMQKEG